MKILLKIYEKNLISTGDKIFVYIYHIKNWFSEYLKVRSHVPPGIYSSGLTLADVQRDENVADELFEINHRCFKQFIEENPKYNTLDVHY